MQHEGYLLEELPLENGLTIFFYDYSRPVAGDRCQVHLAVSVPVQIREDYLRDWGEPRHAYEVFAAAHGNVINFEQKRIRHFIPQQDVPAVLKNLKEEFLRVSRSYLMKESFAPRFIRKAYREWQAQQRLKSFMETVA
jgi:hypothetical protein